MTTNPRWQKNYRHARKLNLPFRRWGALFSSLAMLGLAPLHGCSDTAVEPPPHGERCGDEPISVAALPLRRLNADQYRRTVRDLVGDSEFFAEIDDTDELITLRIVRQYRDAAELVLERRAFWTREVFPCSIEGEEDAACVDNFITGFGSRAYRHPLGAEERSELEAVYADARAIDLSFQESMEVLLQVMLQSPAMLYLYQGGDSEASAPVRLLTDHEVASRLSYFLWGTMPDDALFDAASAGTLGTAAGLAEQAGRLLADPRAENNVQELMSAWLELDGGQVHDALEKISKDEELYPSFDEALISAMRQETEAFIRRVFFEENGDFGDLFTANYAYVNGPLAEIYGVDGPSDADSYQWVDLDEKQRAGLLTRAAFLSVYATATVPSPIRRGVWVLEHALDAKLGEPPPNVDDTPPEGGEVEGEDGEVEVLTVRQDVEARTAGADCQSCHGRINPVGFTFGHYDAIGRYQVEELISEQAIDSAVEIYGTDVDGAYADATTLSEAIGQSETVRRAFAQLWLDRALGKSAKVAESCNQEKVEQDFVSTGKMRELVIAISASHAFRYVNVADEGAE